MKIDFNQKFKTFEGETIKEGAGAKDPKKELTLAGITMNALMGTDPDEKNLKGEDKVKRYDLALKINKDKILEVTAEEISLIKKLIGKFYSALVVGQAFKMLELKELKEEVKA